MSRSTGIAALILSLSTALFAQPPQTPRNDLPQPYRTTRSWGQLPAGMKWAAVTAVEAAPDGSIYVIHRCFANSCAGRSEPPILKVDASGRLLAAWGEGLFNFPHGATVDRDGNLWLTDARGDTTKGHQVFKFSPEGKVLMTLGKAGVSGSGPDREKTQNTRLPITPVPRVSASTRAETCTAPSSVVRCSSGT